MNTTYIFKLPNYVLARAVISKEIAANCPYPIPYAIPQYIRSPQANIQCQTFSCHDYHIGLRICHIKRTFSTQLQIMEDCLTFVYVLRSPDYCIISSRNEAHALPANYYAALFLPPGNYKIKMSKGEHIILYFTLHIRLLETLAQHEPRLEFLLSHFNNPGKSFSQLPQCKIDYQTAKLIRKLQTCDKQGLSLVSELLHILNDLNLHYHHQLHEEPELFDTTTENQLYAILDYIKIRVWHAPLLTIAEISDKFNITPKTLYRNFYKIFGQSPQQYITIARLEAAHQILEEKQILIKDLVNQLGYSHYTTFVELFKDHFGYSPSVLLGRKPDKRTKKNCPKM